jgi:TetR/AcrR family transcriptional regulator, tetracycline repressor protein
LELFDFIQEHLYSQIPSGFSNKNWKTHLSELAISTRKGLLRTPNIVLLFATRPTITASSLKQVEITLNTLIKVGFKQSDVLSIFRNLHVFVLGHVLAEVGRVPGETGRSDETSLDAINIDNYPTLKKAFSSKSSINFERGFKLGLECMLNGFEILLERSK